MESIDLFITIIAGTVNPILVRYALRGYSVFVSDFKDMDKEHKAFVRSTIVGGVLLLTGSIVLAIQAESGIINTFTEAIMSFVIYTFSSQGSYDLVYKKVFKAE